MSQTSELIQTLKACLRAKGITYREVADYLEISEASVRRIFSKNTFTLDRIESVCRLLDISVYELVRMHKLNTTKNVSRLTLEQEQGLAEDPAVLTYFYLMLTGRTPRDIASEFGLDNQQQTTLLVRLSRLDLVELYPNNSGKLLTSRRIEWRRDGPIRKMYKKSVVESFMTSDFGPASQRFQFDTGELSEASVTILIRRLEKLSQEFDELAELDMVEPADQKKAIGMMVGIRPWAYWSILESTANDLGLNVSRSQARSEEVY